MDQQISDFLTQGGNVEQVPRGISGRNPGDPPIKTSSSFFNKPRESRTYVPEVIAALDSRRQEKTTKQKPASPKHTKMHKKVIYDDFGEALRWEWVEEAK